MHEMLASAHMLVKYVLRCTHVTVYMDKVTFEQYHRLNIIFNIMVDLKLHVTLEKHTSIIKNSSV